MTNPMRALVPDPTARGRVAHAAIPLPEVGREEVLIAVGAFSINRGETFLLEDPPAGWRPGKDVAGTIVAAGPEVRDLRVGARVVAHPEQGGWAELVAVTADRVVELPAGIELRQAAALPLAGLTALRLTRATGPLAARRVLLTGASGGVGHAFVQLAAAQGARVTAVTGSPERGARLLELGAVDVVSAIEEAGGPFDVALESTGGDALGRAWASLKPDGRVVWFGQASRTPSTLDFFDWRGATSGTLRRFHYAEDDTPIRDNLETLVRLLASERLQVDVGLVEPWQGAAAALEALLGRRVRGNAVLTIDADGGEPLLDARLPV